MEQQKILFSWLRICFVKIFQKASATCFIFSGLHKPKKQQVHYSWIIRLILLSILGVNEGKWVNAILRTHSKYRFMLFSGLRKYELGQCTLHRRLDFQMGNSTSHATIQAADKIARLWIKMNTLLEFLLTSLKFLLSLTITHPKN